METKELKARGEARVAAEKPSRDKARKQAIAAACKYLEALDGGGFREMDAQRRVGYAIGMICRAAKVEERSFNRIGRERLRGLTAMFNKMARDMEGVVDEGFRAITGFAQE